MLLYSTARRCARDGVLRVAKHKSSTEEAAGAQVKNRAAFFAGRRSLSGHQTAHRCSLVPMVQFVRDIEARAVDQ